MTKNPSSIFHFFARLVKDRKKLYGDKKIKKIQFIAKKKNEMMLFSEQQNVFPDMALKVATGYPEDSDIFRQSGALIELKDSTTSYTVTPFNSTIPIGIKNITAKDVNVGEKLKDPCNVKNLPMRHVYYLVRGRNEKKEVGRKQKTKICLVHGSFFEPNNVKNLIASSFRQVLDAAEETELDDEQKYTLCEALANKGLFSTHRPEKEGEGYLSIQFRVIVKTNKYGNILSNSHHPEIEDDTLNFVIPVYSELEEARKKEALAIHKILKTAGLPQVAGLKEFFIQNYNSDKYFWVLQIPLK